MPDTLQLYLLPTAPFTTSDKIPTVESFAALASLYYQATDATPHTSEITEADTSTSTAVRSESPEKVTRYLNGLEKICESLCAELMHFKLFLEDGTALTPKLLANIICQLAGLEAAYTLHKENDNHRDSRIARPNTDMLRYRQQVLVALLPKLLSIGELLEKLNAIYMNIAPKGDKQFSFVKMRPYIENLKWHQAIAFATSYLAWLNTLTQSNARTSQSSEAMALSIAKNDLQTAHAFLEKTYFYTLVHVKEKSFLHSYWLTRFHQASEAQTLAIYGMQAFLLSSRSDTELRNFNQTIQSKLKSPSFVSNPALDNFDLFFQSLLKWISAQYSESHDVKLLQSVIDVMLTLTNHTKLKVMGTYHAFDYCLVLITHIQQTLQPNLSLADLSEFTLDYLCINLFNAVNNSRSFSENAKALCLLFSILFNRQQPEQAKALQQESNVRTDSKVEKIEMLDTLCQYYIKLRNIELVIAEKQNTLQQLEQIDKKRLANNETSKQFIDRLCDWYKWIDKPEDYKAKLAVLIELLKDDIKAHHLVEWQYKLICAERCKGSVEHIAHIQKQIEQHKPDESIFSSFSGLFGDVKLTPPPFKEKAYDITRKAVYKPLLNHLCAAYVAIAANPHREIFARGILLPLLKACLSLKHSQNDINTIAEALTASFPVETASTYFATLGLSASYLSSDMQTTSLSPASSSTDSAPHTSALRLRLTPIETQSRAQQLPVSLITSIRKGEAIGEISIAQNLHAAYAGNSLFHLAIIHSHAQLLDDLLAHHGDWVDADGNSLLHLAVFHGKTELIAGIVKARPQLLNKLNHLRQSAMHIAALNADTVAMQKLIDLNAHPYLQDSEGKQPQDYYNEATQNKVAWDTFITLITPNQDGAASKLRRAQSVTQLVDLDSLPAPSDTISTPTLTSSQPKPDRVRIHASAPSVVRPETTSKTTLFGSLTPQHIDAARARNKARKEALLECEQQLIALVDSGDMPHSLTLIIDLINEYNQSSSQEKYIEPTLRRVIAKLGTKIDEDGLSQIINHVLRINCKNALIFLIVHVENFASYPVSINADVNRPFIFSLLQQEAYRSLFNEFMNNPSTKSKLLDCHNAEGLTPLQFAIKENYPIEIISALVTAETIHATGKKVSCFTLSHNRVVDNEDNALNLPTAPSTASVGSSLMSVPSLFSVRPSVTFPNMQPLILAIQLNNWETALYIANHSNFNVLDKTTDHEFLLCWLLSQENEFYLSHQENFTTLFKLILEKLTLDNLLEIKDSTGNTLLHKLLKLLSSLRLPENDFSKTLCAFTLSIIKKCPTIINEKNNDDETPCTYCIEEDVLIFEWFDPEVKNFMAEIAIALADDPRMLSMLVYN